MKYIFLITVYVLLNFSSAHSQPVYMWTQPGGGVNGDVNAVTVFEGRVVVAGSFDSAGTTFANNIAAWNGSEWENLGDGLGQGSADTVYALTVFNGELIAGGSFTLSGSTQVNRIAKWNGSSWQPLGAGFNDEVKALIVHNGILFAGGGFDLSGSTAVENIAQWNGSTWQAVGSGLDEDVYAFTVFNGNLVAGGRFVNSGLNRIASWNGTVWNGFGNGFGERVFALTVYNNELIAGGRFENAGYEYLAKWNGSNWSNVGGGIEDRVYSLTVYKNELVAGGQFKFAGSSNLYVNRVASWDGAEWKSFSTGMNGKVNALAVLDSSLIAGGEFLTAGGLPSKHVSIWEGVTTYSASGIVRYNTNFNPVGSGIVYALRIDYYTREVIKVDSAQIGANGRYTLAKVPENVDALIITRANDELDFVPTYYPSSILWETAETVNLSGNTDSINIDAFKIENDNNPGSIGGRIILNYLPAGFITGSGLPFKSDAITYFKLNNQYKGYGISNNFENYITTSLPEGNYEIIVNRIGYETATGNAELNFSGGFHLDSVNFILDTVKIVNIVNIKNHIPDNFNLHQNYPNPFNPVTKITFDLTSRSNIVFEIFDITGRRISTLVNNMDLNPGTYGFTFNASVLPSGVYFYRLIATDMNGNVFADSKKMILLK